MRRLTALLTVLLTVPLTAHTAAAQPFVPVDFQGRLDRDGQPYTGSADMRFTLYPAPEATDAVAGPYDAPGVQIDGGLFTASFELDTDGLQPKPYWIEIEVFDEALGYVALAPRTRYNPAALAVQALGAQIDRFGANTLGRTGVGERFAANHSGTTSNTTAGGAWQSFVPTVTGNLRSAAIAAEIVDANFIRIIIYEGEGTAGPEIFNTGGTALGVYTIAEDIEDGPLLVAGQTYTILASARKIVIEPATARFYYTEFNAYPDGASSISGPRLAADIPFTIRVAAPGASAVQVWADGSFRADEGAAIEQSLSLNPISDPDKAFLQLPIESISSLNLINEPGIDATTLAANDISNSSFSFVGSESIALPASGYLVAQYTAVARNASASTVTLELSLRDPNANARTQTLRINPAPGSYTELPVSLTGVFQAFPAGAFNVQLYARATGAPSPSNVDLRDGRLVLMYFPTAYGTPDLEN